MAELNCLGCDEWLATVDDVTWRVCNKSRRVAVEGSLVTSRDYWSNLEVVEKRAEEWRERGVYDPMPPPPDPANASVTLRCGCGTVNRFEHP